MKFYIAAPFFNKAQIEKVEVVKEMLTAKGFDYFSPKDDCLFENNKGIDSEAIFTTNCVAISNCDAMIIITDGRDVGSMWEAGYAFGINKENIIYAWIDYAPEANFNLMLSHSGDATALGYEELHSILNAAKNLGYVPKHEYTGKME